MGKFNTLFCLVNTQQLIGVIRVFIVMTNARTPYFLIFTVYFTQGTSPTKITLKRLCHGF